MIAPSVGSRFRSALIETPPDQSAPPRDDLVIKILIAIRLPGVDVRDVIQAHRRYLVELMQQWTRVKADAAPEWTISPVSST